MNRTRRAQCERIRLLRGLLACAVVAGCAHDSLSPLSKLNFFSPTPAYKSMYGPTPAEEMEQLRNLAERAADMDAAEAARWSTQLSQQMATESDGLLREQIVKTLAELPGDASLEALRQALADPSPPVRLVAVDAWSRRAGESGLTALAEALARDPDMRVRLQAARAMSRIKSPQAARVLAGFLDDREPGIQLAAVGALRQITGKELPDDVSAWKAYIASNYGPAVAAPESDGEAIAHPGEESLYR